MALGFGFSCPVAASPIPNYRLNRPSPATLHPGLFGSTLAPCTRTRFWRMGAPSTCRSFVRGTRYNYLQSTISTWSRRPHVLVCTGSAVVGSVPTHSTVVTLRSSTFNIYWCRSLRNGRVLVLCVSVSARFVHRFLWVRARVTGGNGCHFVSDRLLKPGVGWKCEFFI